MTNKVYGVTDLGVGDGGKGGVVNAIAGKMNVHTVVKEGGAQGSHGVIDNLGRPFPFSQWGCGTFSLVPTFLSKRMIISPTGLINEADALIDHGISDPYGLISADPDCICSTPYHQVWSRLYEISLRDHPHGTVGLGVGKAYRQFLESPEMTIYAKDLLFPQVITDKLSDIRIDIYSRFSNLRDDDVNKTDIPYLRKNFDLLMNFDVFADIVDKMAFVGRLLRLQSLEDVLKKDGSIVSERSHGVLSDSESFLKPHVSSIRTLPRFSQQMYREAGFDGRYVNLAVHRAYEIRHGAGPLPTEDEQFRKELLPHSHKMTNRWQGEVRVGAFDVMLANYAINTCGGAESFDGLCLTWFDQVIQRGYWDFCHSYELDGRSVPQSDLTNLSVSDLYRVKPVLDRHYYNNEPVQEYCQRVMNDYVDIPVRMVSVGPAIQDKYFI